MPQETVYEALRRTGISKRDFLKSCHLTTAKAVIATRGAGPFWGAYAGPLLECEPDALPLLPHESAQRRILNQIEIGCGAFQIGDIWESRHSITPHHHHSGRAIFKLVSKGAQSVVFRKALERRDDSAHHGHVPAAGAACIVADVTGPFDQMFSNPRCGFPHEQTGALACGNIGQLFEILQQGVNLFSLEMPERWHCFAAVAKPLPYGCLRLRGELSGEIRVDGGPRASMRFWNRDADVPCTGPISELISGGEP